MPAVTTDAGIDGKASATESTAESTLMKVVMMKEREAEPYRNAVGVIRQ